MLLNDLLGQPLREMAVSRQDAVLKMMSLQEPLNLHITKIICADVPVSETMHWRSEVKGWLKTISRLVMKSTNKRFSFKFIYNYLYVGPFEGTESQILRDFLETMLEKKIPIKNLDEKYVISKIESFHRSFVNLYVSGHADSQAIFELVSKL